MNAFRLKVGTTVLVALQCGEQRRGIVRDVGQHGLQLEVLQSWHRQVKVGAEHATVTAGGDVVYPESRIAWWPVSPPWLEFYPWVGIVFVRATGGDSDA